MSKILDPESCIYCKTDPLGADVLNWLNLATDRKGYRPTLEAIHITPDELAATDGYRLHRIRINEKGGKKLVHGLPEGEWILRQITDGKTGVILEQLSPELITAHPYPKYQEMIEKQLVSTIKPMDYDAEFWAEMVLNPRFIRDACSYKYAEQVNIETHDACAIIRFYDHFNLPGIEFLAVAMTLADREPKKSCTRILPRGWARNEMTCLKT